MSSGNTGKKYAALKSPRGANATPPVNAKPASGTQLPMIAASAALPVSTASTASTPVQWSQRHSVYSRLPSSPRAGPPGGVFHGPLRGGKRRHKSRRKTHRNKTRRHRK
jgi:hypothetical protein